MSAFIPPHIREILLAFNLKNIEIFRLFDSGHINDSFYVKVADKELCELFLQKINTNVFKDAEGLMHNIERFTSIQSENAHKFQDGKLFSHFPELIRTSTGNSFFKADENNYWRVLTFVPGSYTHEVVKNEEMAYEAGKVVGAFHLLLENADPGEFSETIPFFHNMDWRLKEFENAISEDVSKRLKGVEQWIETILLHREQMCTVNRLGVAGKIPLRVMHNDTKLSNILFDKKEKAICLVDLDTIMPGYIHYDYGDALRSMSSSANEDERDMSKILFLENYFKAFTVGYLSKTKDIITEDEKKTLYLGPLMMTFIMGLRFLTDYLRGDIYYKIAYSEQNLVRARSQLTLFLRMQERIKFMQSCINL